MNRRWNSNPAKCIIKKITDGAETKPQGRAGESSFQLNCGQTFLAPFRVDIQYCVMTNSHDKI